MWRVASIAVGSRWVRERGWNQFHPLSLQLQRRRPLVLGCSQVLHAYNAVWLFGACWPFAGTAPLTAVGHCIMRNRI
jgi:hypothetical protein